MDIKRAKQIVSSSADIDVTFQGVSVWIDELHEEEKMATVHLRGPLEERTRVAIQDLTEEKE
ncbi:MULTISPECIES: H-type small acid-soluble spore protein [Bacillaceae]|uniref:H-type small acid-soluble spore protein n=1 Tax=Bacillaceae TaxID=186817 RepID=UPI000E71BB87|nr:H-type small acid-soluble spore protein [Bacillus sp. PK3_68]RJS60071.1 H-type small acid-soluble spore protein [Bacillus sp. PK3_68]